MHFRKYKIFVYLITNSFNISEKIKCIPLSNHMALRYQSIDINYLPNCLSSSNYFRFLLRVKNKEWQYFTGY